MAEGLGETENREDRAGLQQQRLETQQRARYPTDYFVDSKRKPAYELLVMPQLQNSATGI